MPRLFLSELMVNLISHFFILRLLGLLYYQLIGLIRLVATDCHRKMGLFGCVRLLGRGSHLVLRCGISHPRMIKISYFLGLRRQSSFLFRAFRFAVS